MQIIEYAKEFKCNPQDVLGMHYKWFSLWQYWEKIKSARAVKQKQLSDGKHTYSTEEVELLNWLRKNE
jgi:hypothetical protein